MDESKSSTFRESSPCGTPQNKDDALCNISKTCSSSQSEVLYHSSSPRKWKQPFKDAPRPSLELLCLLPMDRGLVDDRAQCSVPQCGSGSCRHNFPVLCSPPLLDTPVGVNAMWLRRYDPVCGGLKSGCWGQGTAID